MHGVPTGSSTFISCENIPYKHPTTGATGNLFNENETLVDTGGGPSGGGRSAFPTAIILGSSTIEQVGGGNLSNKAFLGIHLNRTHSVDAEIGELEEAGGHRNRTATNAAYERRTLQADDVTFVSQTGPGGEDSDAAFMANRYYASRFPSGIPDTQTIESAPDQGLLAFDSSEEFHNRRYVFHLVAKLHSDNVAFSQGGVNIGSYDVGDEFDFNPVTGHASAATGGRNTVKVFLIEEMSPSNDHVSWVGNPGSVLSETAYIEHAYATNAINDVVYDTPVSAHLGVRPVRKTLYTLPDEVQEEEEIEEVVDVISDEPIDTTPIEDPTEDPVEDTVIDEILDPVDLDTFTDSNPTSTSNLIWQRVGWTISYYPELKAWGSFHDYIPHHYTYTSKTFYSFFNWEDYPKPFWINSNIIGVQDTSWTIWEHNRMEAPGQYYCGHGTNLEQIFTRPFEIEIIQNSERDMSKIFSSFSYETEVYKALGNSGNGAFELNQAQFKRLDQDGFSHFFVYNNTQHSGITPISYLENVRKVGHVWSINKFRDFANLYTTTFPSSGGEYAPNSTTTSGFEGAGSNLQLVTLESNTSPEDPTNSFVDFVGNHDVHDMFEATWGLNGAYTIYTNSFYIDKDKNWTKQRKFKDTYLGIRLIHNNLNKNFVNLYSTFVGMRKNIR